MCVFVLFFVIPLVSNIVFSFVYFGVLALIRLSKVGTLTGEGGWLEPRIQLIVGVIDVNCRSWLDFIKAAVNCNLIKIKGNYKCIS